MNSQVVEPEEDIDMSNEGRYRQKKKQILGI